MATTTVDDQSVANELAKLHAQIAILKKSLRAAKSQESADQLAEKLAETQRDFRLLAESIGMDGEKFSINEIIELSKKFQNRARSKAQDTTVNKHVPVETEYDYDPSTARSNVGVAVDQQRLLFDFVYFCLICLQIVYRPGLNREHPEGGYGPFKLSEGQEKAIAPILHRLLVQLLPVRAQMLKTRQLGNTTLLLALAVWMMVTHDHYMVMFIIDKDDHARTKRDVVIRWIEGLAPYGIFPGIKTKKEKYLVLTNGSTIFFESSQSPNPGTSEMIHMLIESEKPKWVRGRAEQVQNSVLPGLATAPLTCHIDESTAMGQDSFYRKWMRWTTEPDDNNLPIFLSWTLSNEYRLEVPDICYDKDGNFIYLNELEEVGDYDVETDSNINEEQVAKKYKLEDEQVFWRRTTIRGKFEGNRTGFDQEYPITPDHAYRSTQFGFFAKRLHDYVRLAGERGPKYQRFDILDANGYEDTSRVPHYIQLKPKLQASTRGPLLIRELPKPGNTYFIGADVSEGKVVVNEAGKDDPDYTFFSVKDQTGRTVAIYMARIRPEDAWLPLILLTMLYDAYVNGERNGAGGTLLAFFWMTKWHKNLVEPTPRGSPVRDRTWTYMSKQRDRLLKALRASYSADPDRIFPWRMEDESALKQIGAFIVRVDDGRPQAAVGFHDDFVLAEAHSERLRTYILGEFEVRGLQPKNEPAIQVLTDEDQPATTYNVDMPFDMWSDDDAPEYAEIEF